MDTLTLFEKIAGQNTGSLTEKLAADIVAMVYEKLAAVAPSPKQLDFFAKRLARVVEDTGRRPSWRMAREAMKKFAPGGALASESAAAVGPGSLKLRPELPAASTKQIEDKIRLMRAQRAKERVQLGNRY